MASVDVLVPTRNRRSSLIMTLSSLAAGNFMDLHLVLSDQSRVPVARNPVVRSIFRIIEARGGSVEHHYRRTSKGIAEQRDFLLRHASAKYVLYLDDDVFMSSWVLGKLLDTIREQGCAFVGAFPAGLSFREDVRPEQQRVEFWEGPVQPEVVEPGSPEWERANLHRAANIYHVGAKMSPEETRLYKIAWISTCILYNRQMLLEVGGFSFWPRLPRYHSGEEVLVQNLLMRRWGGCGILPSGTYFSQVPTTVLNAQGTVDGHALELLPEMIARYVEKSGE